MNKKGLLIHLVLLGLLVGVGSFILLSGTLDLESDIKGKWQLDFLTQNYQEAEKQLLRNEILIKQAGIEVARQLAKNGGYAPGAESNCGRVEEAQIWFKEGTWCFKGVAALVPEMVTEKLTTSLPDNTYSDITFSGPFLVGKGGKGVVSREKATYTFDTSFSAYLGYSFNEYQQLQEEGLRLLSSCSGKEELKTCLDNAKLNYWKYGSCEEESFPDSTIVPFCITSPQLAYLPTSEGQKLVTYNLALDFSSSAEK